MLVVCFFTILTTSCVPLLVGGVVGYIARDQGIGVIDPVSGSDQPETYDSTPLYESDDYDYPVY
jgi:hypothetical protein